MRVSAKHREAVGAGLKTLAFLSPKRGKLYRGIQAVLANPEALELFADKLASSKPKLFGGPFVDLITWIITHPDEVAKFIAMIVEALKLFI